MPGIIVDGVITEEVPNEASSSQNKENLSAPRSPVASAMVPSMQSETLEMHVENSGAGEPSIEQLYNNVCEMESSSEGGSPSRESFGSDGEESRIDSELRHLVAGEMEAVKVIEEEEEKDKEGGSVTNAPTTVENGTPVKTQSSNSSKKSKKTAKSQLESDASVGPNGKASPEEGESEVSKPGSRVGRRRKASANPQNGTEEAGLDNPDLGPFLLKHARDLIASDNPRRALKYALRATKSFEKCAGGKPSLNLVMSLHVVAAIHCNMGKYEEAVPVLQRSLEIPVTEEGQEHALAKFSAQIGVLHYISGNYGEAYDSFKSAITKLRTCGEKKSAFFGIALNQMGLACVQRYSINEAAELFEEARTVLEQEYGPYHPDTLGVYSNLAGTYDAMGRLDEAIEILEYVVGMREEKLGTANPDVDDEKRRLAELLKEAGRGRSRKAMSLENLLETNNPYTVTKRTTVAA
uniref:Uncharacterized protein n=1 Tax=Avena sativa TaxID=4498 RepID=A0ACD5ZKT1_AVESA